MRVCFHQSQLGALLLQQRPVHPTPQEKKLKILNGPLNFFALKFLKLHIFPLHLIQNMDSYLPGEVPRSGEIFGNYILSAMI